MANAFEILDRIPAVAYSGDAYQWSPPALEDDYPIAEYSMEVQFRRESDDITKAAAADEANGTYVFTLPSDLTAGEWRWALIVTRDSDDKKITISEGILLVRAKPGTASNQSHAAKMLVRIENELQARIGGTGSANKGYTIDGRSMDRLEIKDLEDLRVRYQSIVNEERRLASGKPKTQTRVMRLCQ